MSATSCAAPDRDAVGRLTAAFAEAWAGVGPLEPAAHVAVGLSGGPDSWALTLLLADWARAAGGRLTALIVDHQMRPGSATEAAATAAQAAARGINAVILPWTPPWPARRDLAAARTARYRLLTGWCADQAVLHLAVAHHADDQAETVALRASRGSGADGLAGMAPVVHLPQGRLLRPLLGVEKAALVALCAARGVAVVDDPSNRDPARLRAGLRATLDGPDRQAWLRAATDAAAARTTRAAAMAGWLGGAVSLDPAGYAIIARAALADDAATGGLTALLTMLGGNLYPPAPAAVQTLRAALTGPAFRPRTLAGCTIRARRDRVLLVREAAACPAPVALAPGAAVLWDRRFVVRTPADLPSGLWLGPLGARAAADLAQRRAIPPGSAPFAAWAALPTLSDLDGPLFVPHLKYRWRGDFAATLAQVTVISAPARPLLGHFLYVPTRTEVT